MEELIKHEDVLSTNYDKCKERPLRTEESNRTIQERACASYHQLLCKLLLEKIIEIITIEEATKINLFHAVCAGLKYYNLLAVMCIETIGFEINCDLSLGEHFQASDALVKPNNEVFA